MSVLDEVGVALHGWLAGLEPSLILLLVLITAIAFIGVGVALLAISNTAKKHQLQSQREQAEREALSAGKAQLSEELHQLREQYHVQSMDFSGTEQRLVAEKRALQEKFEMLEKNRVQMAGEFELLANRIFEEKTERLHKLSETQLAATLAPFKHQLSDFRKRVDDVYSAEAKERHLLNEQIKKLREESVRISEDANNLANALRHDNKAQGNWGELTLVRALEVCGLRNPEEYEIQVSLKADDGSRQVPDVVVHLPGNKDIVIDSKVSLLAYTRFFEAESAEAKEQALKEHIASVRSHIKQLSAKRYDQLEGVNTLDYVMLYIPVEGASMLVLQNDRDIWRDAYSKNIVLVSPTNLIAILRSVETIWRHERQNKNAEQIAREAGRLYDQFVLFTQSLDDIGKHLGRASEAYEKSVDRLTRQRGNLVRRVENLKKLGAKASKGLPDRWLDEQAAERSETKVAVLETDTEDGIAEETTES